MKRRLRLKITQVRLQTMAEESAPLRLLCPVCKREVEMLSSAHAQRILGIDPQRLGHFVAAGLVHTVRTVSGKTLVCKDSLVS